VHIALANAVAANHITWTPDVEGEIDQFLPDGLSFEWGSAPGINNDSAAMIGVFFEGATPAIRFGPGGSGYSVGVPTPPGFTDAEPCEVAATTLIFKSSIK